MSKQQDWIEEAIVLLRLDSEEVRSRLSELGRLGEQQKAKETVSILYTNNTKHERRADA